MTIWRRIVEEYSRGNLTNVSDILPATSAITTEMQGQTKFTYLYGLWQEDLSTGLLWSKISDDWKRTVAPSWSWAARPQRFTSSLGTQREKGSLFPQS